MKKLSAYLSFFLLTLISVVNAHAATASQNLSIKTPEVRLYKVGSNSAEAFMEIQNNSTQAYTLIAATTPVDQETQLHKTIIQNGKATMVQIKQITIPAKQDEDLQFGGIHVMLIGLDEKLKANEIIPITLIFNDGSDLKINATVVS